MEQLNTKSKTNASLSLDEERPLPSLQATLTRFLQKQLKLSNIFEWLEIADRYRFSELFEFISSFVCQHFVELSSSEQFLAIGDKRLRWLVCNDNVVASEASLLEALIRWYKHDEKGREENFKAMFSFISLDYITNDYLTSILKKENVYKVLLKKLERKKGGKKPSLLRTVERHAKMRAKCSNLAVFSLSPYFRLLLSLPGPHWEEKEVVMNCWQPFIESKKSAETWLKMCNHQITPELPDYEDRMVASHLININKEVYVIDTIELRQNEARNIRTKCYLSYLFSYDITDGSLCLRATLNYHGPHVSLHRRDFVLIRVGFFLYFTRPGADGRTFLDRFNTRCSRNWEPLSPSNYLLNNHFQCCTVSDGIQSIFVVRYQQLGERYDIFSNTWEFIAPMPDVGRIDDPIAAVVFDKQLIVYRLGRNGYSEVSYSIVKDEWQFIRKMSMVDVLNHCQPPLPLSNYTFVSDIARTKVFYKKTLYKIKKKGSKKLLCSLPIRGGPSFHGEYGPVALSRGAVEALKIIDTLHYSIFKSYSPSPF